MRLRAAPSALVLRCAPASQARTLMVFVPGSNLLLAGGLFVAGWLGGRNAFNRGAPGYVEEAAKRAGDAEGRDFVFPPYGAPAPPPAEEAREAPPPDAAEKKDA